MVTREPLVSKMFRHFGETSFKPGSFKFNYCGELYDIHSVNEGAMVYGPHGWSLRPGDSSQFIVTKVDRPTGLFKGCCVIYIAELR